MNRYPFIHQDGHWFYVTRRISPEFLPEWRARWAAIVTRDVLRRRRLGWRS